MLKYFQHIGALLKAKQKSRVKARLLFIAKKQKMSRGRQTV
jgi:hypothetical protein